MRKYFAEPSPRLEVVDEPYGGMPFDVQIRWRSASTSSVLETRRAGKIAASAVATTPIRNAVATLAASRRIIAVYPYWRSVGRHRDPDCEIASASPIPMIAPSVPPIRPRKRVFQQDQAECHVAGCPGARRVPNSQALEGALFTVFATEQDHHQDDHPQHPELTVAELQRLPRRNPTAASSRRLRARCRRVAPGSWRKRSVGVACAVERHDELVGTPAVARSSCAAASGYGSARASKSREKLGRCRRPDVDRVERAAGRTTSRVTDRRHEYVMSPSLADDRQTVRVGQGAAGNHLSGMNPVAFLVGLGSPPTIAIVCPLLIRPEKLSLLETRDKEGCLIRAACGAGSSPIR